MKRIMVCILSLQESDRISLAIAIFCPNEFFIKHKYTLKGSYREFFLLGLSDTTYELLKLMLLTKPAFKLPQNQHVRYLTDPV